MEAEYDKLLQDFISEMMDVEAPLEDYQDALRTAINELQIVLDVDG